MRRTLCALVAGALVLLGGSPRLLVADSAAAYTVIDLGAYNPVGMNAAGDRIAAHATVDAKAYVLTVGAGDAVSAAPVPGVLAGKSTTLLGMGPQGVVVGVSRIDTPDDISTGCDTPVTYHNDRACKGGPSGVETLGAAVVTVFDGFCHPGTHSTIKEDSAARAVNSSGVAVGQSSPLTGVPGTPVATRFDGAATALSTSYSDATAINAAGKIVGYVRGAAQRMTLWYGGEHDVDVPGSVGSTPFAINSHDLIVGFRTIAGPLPHAFATQLSGTSVVTDDELPPLPGGFGALATAVNDDGLIVGAGDDASHSGQIAIVWKDKTAFDLNGLVDPASPGLPTDGVSTVVLRYAVAVSTGGDILCRGELKGQSGTSTHAYLLRAAAANGIFVSPPTLDFGNVIVGEGKVLSVTLTNRTAAPVTLTTAKPGKPFVAFAPGKFTLAPGASREVRVRVAPKDTTSHTAPMTFTAGPGNPVTAQLVVHGVPEPEAIRVTPQPLDFGSYRQMTHGKLTVTNLEDVPIRVKVARTAKDSVFTVAPLLSLPARGAVDVDVSCRFAMPKRDAGSGAEEGADWADTFVFTPIVPHRAKTSVEVKAHADNYATILSIQGEVGRRQGVGPWGPIEVGAVLGPNDELFIGVDSKVVVQLPDGDVLEFRELSQVLFSTVLRKEELKNVQIQLLLGESKSHVRKEKALDTNFELQTPTATASVRGTEFTVRHDDVTQTTTVRTYEHSVLVKPANAALKPVIVPAGMQVTVTPTSISAVQPYSSAGALRVLSVHGAVASRQGSVGAFETTVPLGTDLHPGDELLLGDGARVEAALPDGSVVTFTGSAKVAFGALATAKKGGLATFDVTYGRVVVRRSEAKFALGFEIRTPAATTSIARPGLVEVFHSDGYRTTTVKNLQGKAGVVVTPTGAGLAAASVVEDRQVRVEADVVWPVEWF